MKKMLAPLVCLLFVAINAAAQSESQAAKGESLKGLKGVALSVLVNRGGVLDETQRLATLKLLQDDAEARFQKAGIPLLIRVSQEAERELGSPRFLVMITLNQPNGHNHQVYIESKLVQDVRLSRDPSIQVSVTTWAAYSVGDGPGTTDTEPLRLQVGSEVDRFIKAYLKANPK